MKFKNRLLKIFFNPKIILTFLVSFTLFSLINVYIFLKPEDALSQIQYNTTKYSLSFSLEKFLDFTNIHYYPFYYFYKFAFGEILSILLILGLIYGFFRYFKNTLILMATIVPFLYMFLVLSNTTETRFYSAIIPLVLFFPAVLTVDLAKVTMMLVSKINIKPTLPLLIAVLSFAVGYQSLNLSLLSSYYFSTPHSSDVLQDWILKEMPDNSNYVYFWGTPSPPGYKKINSTFITVDENNYPSMEELKTLNTDYVAIGSDPGDVINGLFWMNDNRIIKKAVFNDTVLWKQLDESYASLITHELATYRIKEFSKPWPALDPSFFVVKFPKFWNINKGNKIVEYNFDNMSDLDDWGTTTQDASPYYRLAYTSNLGYKNKGAILVQPTRDTFYHPPITTFYSKSFKVNPLDWYILSAWTKRDIDNRYTNSKNGFIRLNFYNKEGNILKSYVSQQLKFTKDIQILNAAGFAPINSDHGEIMVQFNNSYNENYIFDNIGVYTSKDKMLFDKNKYPFFDRELSKSFIWLPHL